MDDPGCSVAAVRVVRENAGSTVYSSIRCDQFDFERKRFLFCEFVPDYFFENLDAVGNSLADDVVLVAFLLQ